MTTANLSQRPVLYQAVDIFKWIAALLVASMHSAPFIQNETANYYFTCFCRIAVPFFFLFSSFIFFKKQGDITSFVKRLLLLYLCWFILESPIIYYNYFVASGKPFIKNLLIFLRGLFINSTFPGSWFITALWQGVLIVWWLSKKLAKKWLILLGLFCILAPLPGTLYYGLIHNTPLQRPYWIFNMIFCPANSFITAIPYCLAGKYLAEMKTVPSSRKIGFLLLLTFFLGIIETSACKSSYYISDTYISLYLFTPLLVLLLLSSRIHLPNPITQFFRKTSILIYFLHLPIIFILRHFFQIEKGVNCWLITIPAAIVLATFIYFLSKKCRVLTYLY